MIDPNATREIIVYFSPDHQSQAYADTLEIKLNGQCAYTMDIVGQAWSNNMYAVQVPHHQDDDISKHLKIKPIKWEYMTASASLPEGTSPPPKPLLMMFVHHVREDGDSPSTKAIITSASGVEEREASGKKKTEANGTEERDTSGKSKALAGERGPSGKSKVQMQLAESGGAKVVKELEVGCIKSAQVKKVKRGLCVCAC